MAGQKFMDTNIVEDKNWLTKAKIRKIKKNAAQTNKNFALVSFL